MKTTPQPTEIHLTIQIYSTCDDKSRRTEQQNEGRGVSILKSDTNHAATQIIM